MTSGARVLFIALMADVIGIAGIAVLYVIPLSLDRDGAQRYVSIVLLVTIVLQGWAIHGGMRAMAADAPRRDLAVLGLIFALVGALVAVLLALATVIGFTSF